MAANEFYCIWSVEPEKLFWVSSYIFIFISGSISYVLFFLQIFFVGFMHVQTDNRGRVGVCHKNIMDQMHSETGRSGGYALRSRQIKILTFEAVFRSKLNILFQDSLGTEYSKKTNQNINYI